MDIKFLEFLVSHVQVVVGYFVISSWEMLMGYIYLDAFTSEYYLSKRKSESILGIVLGVMGCILFFVVRFQALISWAVPLVMSLYFFLSYAIIKRQCNVFMAEISCIYNMTVFLMDLAWIFGLSAITSYSPAEMDVLFQSGHTSLQIIICYLSRPAILMIMFYVCDAKEKIGNLDSVKNRWFLGIVIGLEAFAMYIFSMIYESNAEIQGLIWAVLFLVLVLIGVTIYFYFIRQDEKQKSEIVEIGNRALEKNYHDLMLAEQEKSIIYHDFKNQIFAIENYLYNGEVKEAIQYLEQIKKPFLEYQKRIQSGNQMVDLILGSKKREAEEHEIKMEVRAEKLQHLTIKDEDICCILSNLLDNAIEANSIEEKGGKWIRVSIYTKDRILFLNIVNSIQTKPEEKGKRLLSTKGESGFHGFGLDSVKHTVNKYNGIYEYRFNEEKYETNITLFF